MRVFLPATLPALRRMIDNDGLQPPMFGCSVTPDLRAWLGTDDVEMLEYTALTDAAAESLQLLAAEPMAPRRRTVVVVEIPDAQVIPDPAAGLSAVRVTSGATMRDVVAVHVDDDEATAAVAAAADVLDAADLGDAAATALVSTVADRELLWYAAQEIGDLV